MTTKRVELNAFVGKGFDMEFYSSITPDVKIIAKLDKIIKGDIFDRYLSGRRLNTVFCRPRLDKAQVLDDYSCLPDGLVGKLRTLQTYRDYEQDLLVLVEDGGFYQLGEQHKENGCVGVDILSFEPIGLHPDYADQAKEWGYPVVEL